MQLEASDHPGSRGRQLQVQFTAALLRWGIDSELLPSSWAPPLDLSVYVGRKHEERGITTPIDVIPVLGLVEAIPDPRWRLAFQLMAAYGLRPEELQHLESRQEQLWTSYQMISYRGRTRFRMLRLLPCDDWAQAWQLENAFRADRMPPMRPGHGAEDLGTSMRRRSLWQQLRRDYEEQGEKMVLYSCRHGDAHRAHIISELPPKVMTAGQKLSVGIREQFKKNLAEHLIEPRIPASRLRGSTNRYAIKLRAAGFRLIDEVRDQQVLVLVLAVGKRDRNAAYHQSDQR